MFCHPLLVIFSLFFIGPIVCQSDNEVLLAPLKDELISLRTLTEKLQQHILKITQKNAEFEEMNLQQEKQILSNIRSLEIQGVEIKKRDDDFRRLQRELKHVKETCKSFSSFPPYKEPSQNVNSFVPKEASTGQRQVKRSQRPLQTKRASTSPQFFTAENSNNMYVSPNQIVRFDHVVTNDGQGYDASNGIFTANSNGVYVFYLQTRSTDRQCFVEIVKTGSRLVSTWSGQGDHLSDSTMVVLRLQIGEKVWIEDRSYHSNNCEIDDLSSFSGFMLHAEE